MKGRFEKLDDSCDLHLALLAALGQNSRAELALFIKNSMILQYMRGIVMQIFTRQVNEGLVIGEGIHVTVLDIHDDHVRLGISSPNEFPSYWEQTLYLDEEEHGAGSVRELQVH